MNRLQTVLPGADPAGDPVALSSVGTIAAPLLAGFAGTAVTLTVQSPGGFRLAKLVSLAGTLAVLCLLTAVQCTFNAQRYTVSPADVLGRFPSGAFDADSRLFQLLIAYNAVRKQWADRARRCYNAGVVCFLGTFTLLLVPPKAHLKGTATIVGHWAPTTLAGLATIAEATWAVTAFLATPHLENPARPRHGRMLDYKTAQKQRAEVRAKFWEGDLDDEAAQELQRAGKSYLLDRLLPNLSARLAQDAICTPPTKREDLA